MSSAHTHLPASDNARSSTRRTADVLVDVLAQSGVEVVFGLPGGTIAPLFDALMDHPEIRVVTTKHEAGAMFAAAGYARTTGKLGVVMVTSGPGITNALTGLASAWCDGLPLLLLAGEVPRRVFGKAALQDGSSYHLDMVGLTRHISKLSLQLHEPNAAAGMLRRAIATSLSGRRGPVTVTIPVDVSSTPLPVVASASLEVSTTFKIDPQVLRRTSEALLTAERPLIFAGSGIRFGEASKLVREVAERAQCPVMTTPKGKGVFPEDHPLSLGVFGIGGHPSATKYLEQGVDVLLAIGTSLGELETNGWSPLVRPTSELIQVDIEALQVGRSYSPSISITAPADAFARNLLEVLPQSEKRRWLGVQYHAVAKDAGNGPSGRIAPHRALWEMQQALPRDTIFSCDVGEHSVFATHYLRTHHHDSWVFMNGLGSMGQSIGSAIGAQLAFPRRRVAAICGDGCFAMACNEVATAAQEGLPITVFVFNDERLGMVELGNGAIFGRTPPYPTTPMDVSLIARGLGADALTVRSAGEILRSDAIRDRRRRPLVVDVQIDPSIRMPKHGRFEALGNAQRNGRN